MHLLLLLHNFFLANILLPAVVFFMLGGTAARQQPMSSIIPPIIVLAICISSAVILYGLKKSVAIYPLFCSFFLFGLIHTGLSLQPPNDPSHIRNLVRQKTKATITGTLTSMVEFDGSRSRFNLAVDSLRYHLKTTAQNNKFIRVKGKVRCSLTGRVKDNIRPGATLMLIADLKPTYNYQTPGAFDYILHMANRSIFVTGQIASPLAILQIQDHTKNKLHRYRYWAEQVRQDVANFLFQRLKPETAGIYQALLVGSRVNIPQATMENFKRSGCMHLLAISGIHMGLLALMVSVCISWLLKRSSRIMLQLDVKTAALLFSLLPLLIYAFIAGLNTPVLRAFFMASLMTIAVLLKRQHSLMHLIAAAVIILLAFRPLSLFTASFQLSFSAVFCIALLYPSLLRAFVRQTEIEPDYSDRTKNLPRRAAFYLKSSFLVSIAATLGTLPLLLLHFNRFSTLSPVTNLLVEPFLCFWSLPLGLIAVTLIHPAPSIALYLLHIGAAGITITTKITAAASTLPGVSCWTITPSPTEICMYYSMLALWFYRKTIQINLKMPLLGTAALLLLFTKELWLPVANAKAEISYLDVGQGSSTWMRLPHGKTILVDAGSHGSSRFNIGERIIAPFLWKKRIWHLDDAVITHMHADHYNGMDFIITHFTPKRLFIPAGSAQDCNYQKIAALAKNVGAEIIHPVAGQVESPEAYARLCWLGMTGLAGKQATAKKNRITADINNLGLVLKLTYGKHAFLFPGDIDKEAEERLLSSKMDVKADFLLSPHHGSISSSSHHFISAVSPNFIIVSSGLTRGNRYPAPDHLIFWDKKGIATLLTRKLGTITVLADSKRLDVFTGNKILFHCQ